MDRPFVDASAEPGEKALAGALGPALDRFTRVLDLAGSFVRRWTYTKGSGWMLKLHDGRKALLYLIPLAGGFRISMAIRETERDVLLTDMSLAAVHGELSSAKKYTEGFAVAFDVDGSTDFGPVESLIEKLIALRT